MLLALGKQQKHLNMRADVLEFTTMVVAHAVVSSSNKSIKTR
jgi:hypothetical protein